MLRHRSRRKVSWPEVRSGPSPSGIAHPSRSNSYDFLRLCAALAVVVQHSTVHLNASFLWLTPGGRGWFYDGVSAFFIISGLFVYRSATRLRQQGAPWREFYLNRALRIAPAIWFYLLITTVLVLYLGVATWQDLRSQPGLLWLLSGVSLIPVYSPPFLSDFGVGVVNGSLWTIPAEVSFYLAVPLLVGLCSRWGRKIFLFLLFSWAAVSVVIGAMLDGSRAGKFYDITFVPYLWYFSLGILWYSMRESMPRNRLYFLVALAAYCLGAVFAREQPTDIRRLTNLVAAIPLSYVIVYVGEYGPRILNSLTRRIGDLSFGVYIWHMVVINCLLWSGVSEHVRGTALVWVAIGLSMTAALVSWNLVERKALSFKHLTSRRPRQVARDGDLGESRLVDRGGIG